MEKQVTSQSVGAALHALHIAALDGPAEVVEITSSAVQNVVDTMRQPIGRVFTKRQAELYRASLVDQLSPRYAPAVAVEWFASRGVVA